MRAAAAAPAARPDAAAAADVVKAMIWLRERADFAGFNAVYGEYFPHDPPARSAIVSDLLVDCRVEVEVIAWRPVAGGDQ